MIFPIWTIYTFSIKSCYSYLNIFSILPPMISLYRLTIVTLYRHLYIKYIEITYNISYNGSLYFAIPGVIWLQNLEIWKNSTLVSLLATRKAKKGRFC